MGKQETWEEMSRGAAPGDTFGVDDTSMYHV